MTRVVIVAALCGLTACSLIGVRNAPQPIPERGPIHCTDDYVLPVADSLVAVTGLAIFGFEAVQAKLHPNEEGAALGFVFVGGPAGVLGLGFGTAAAYGYTSVASCNAAKAERRARDRH